MAECCSGGIKIIYSCSGQSNVGEIADRAVRKLRDAGFAKMACLAGVGADLSGYVQSAKGADIVYAIDGCATACARKNLERIGIEPKSFVLTDIGCEKGTTEVSQEVIQRVVDKIMNDSSASPVRVLAADGGCSCCG